MARNTTDIPPRLGQAKAKAAPRKPTLKTIAQITGLAVPTVSRALNDAPDIRQKTKELVRRVADEVGYVPNRAGVRLRTGRTNVVALVLAAEAEMMNHNAKLITSVAGAFHETPYHLNIMPFFEHDEIMKPIRYIVETGSADAVIFNQTLPDDPRIAYLLERNFPFVTHGRSTGADRHAWADFDSFEFGKIAVQKLIDTGFRHILLLAPPMTQSYAIYMTSGVNSMAGSAGVTVRVLNDATSDSPNAAIIDSVERALVADPSIDAVICPSIRSTVAAVAAAERQGRQIGKDFGVAAKEAVPFLELFRPGIISVSEDVERAGVFMARAALARIADPTAAPMQDLQVPSPL